MQLMKIIYRIQVPNPISNPAVSEFEEEKKKERKNKIMEEKEGVVVEE